MTGRGIWSLMSVRARRSVVLLWTALFLCSLLMQYASFAAPATVLGAHNEGIFELDGNAVDTGDDATTADDWEGGTGSAADSLFIPGSVEKDGADTSYFKEGGSKDHHDITDWAWSSTDVAPDKDELLDVFAAAYEKDGDTWVYFGADKFDDSGDAQIGFWFFQDDVSTNADGSFAGQHVEGDVLILSDFTNGGSVSLICAYEWNPPGDDTTLTKEQQGDCDLGNNVTLVAAGVACDVGDGTFDICAVVNAAVEDAPWPFTNKDGETDFGVGQFYEGGLNLSDMFGGDAPCFSSFLAETRSSQEVEAQLKDFALGNLDTCVPPDIKTTASPSVIDLGESVTDLAEFSGEHGTVEGTATFFVCGPASSAPNCSTGGTNLGDVTIVDEKASKEFEPDATGWYCFRVAYTPAADSEYLAGSHTNQTTECFRVVQARIDIAKTADAEVVNAGETIGFVVTIKNDGDGAAEGVTVTDTLPTDAGLSWSIDAANTDPGWSIAGGQLRFGPAELAAGADSSAHITSPTTAASCGIVDNTARVTTTNDSQDEATAEVEVLCPDVSVLKTGNGPLLAGQTATFTITVSNAGPGVAKGVTLNDSLPAGAGWTEDSTFCSIADSKLSCSFGDMAAGASHVIHVSRPTVPLDCGTLPNTATVAATNEGSDKLANNESSASITVQCAGIELVKTAGATQTSQAADGTVYVTRTDTATGSTATIVYKYHVTNTSTATLINVKVVDDMATPATGDDVTVCQGVTLAPGASTDCFATILVPVGSRTNVATATGNPQINPSATVADTDDAVVRVPDLDIVKAVAGNSAGSIGGVPQAKQGDTLTFTLTYDLSSGPVTAGVITDVLPLGYTYMTGSATASTPGGEFTFTSFNAATRTLTWNAATVTVDGSVSYTVTVQTGAAELPQPLVNVAAISSGQTWPDDDDQPVLVQEPPAPATATPRITPPPTDLEEQAPGNPGFSLMLVLLGLAGFVLAIGYLTPVPERARRRDRR